MSDALYRTRLRWCAASGRGLIKHYGFSLDLSARPPVLMHIAHLIDLDWSPEIVHIVQAAEGPRRDLEDSEIAELRRWVQVVAAAARQCATGGTR